jgi:succinate-semialdehyde dehydrogenase/glutarate-semialdehyde dehydrogenase
MELGGNAPVIVFADADLDVAVEGAMAAKMRNGGEACTAGNRILVEESVAAEFTEKFVARMEGLVTGDGLEDNTDLGPMIEAKAVDNLESLVADAVNLGARAAVGGQRLDGPGNFFAPTVLVDVPTEARVFREEIFGPIAPIFTFRTEEEAVALGNDTEYGLASYVFTQDPARMYRLADGLEFGLMGYNSGVISNAAAPFGGVKQSGLGREGGAEGIAEYSTVQYIGQRDPYAGR